MKKLILFLFIFLFMTDSSFATIIPASPANEYSESTPAVVLCESLPVLDQRGDQGGKKIDTLPYSGHPISVIESWDGYAKIYYADGSKTGWVQNEYLMLNPAWYVCDEDTAVYAYPDAMSPRTARLEQGTKLPILSEYDDGQSISGWVCVSLRGAAGWIRKTPGDTVHQTWFRPELLSSISYARLLLEDKIIVCTDSEQLKNMSAMLTSAEDHGAATAGCPFTATLTLILADGKEISLMLATDSCCVYRVDGRDYSYARNFWNADEGSPSNELLFQLFGVNTHELWE